MSKTELRFRQIHLDFHTSEHIPGIGADFDPEEFALTLKKAHVDSITLFARCHHGWIYYDTKTHPELRHPHLTRNLLEEQIAACRAHGIRVPVYTTIQWDHYMATNHPEWLVVNDQGHPRGTPIYEPGFYRYLCVNSPYRDFLKVHLKDLLENVDMDGFFLDIVHTQDCSCRYCRQGMEEAGLDPTNRQHRIDYGIEVINEFKREMSQIIWEHNPELSVFYNAGHVGPRHRKAKDAYSHFELESLPGGYWGYSHFPVTMRYARNLGQDCLGHTGKFHTAWGDFHSFKNKAALEFECFRMMAMGAKCMIGDQLDPSGKIDPYVYELIGSVYSQVEEKEPWCKNVKPVVDIGVFTPEAFPEIPQQGTGRISPTIRGVTRMLQEAAYQFDILDRESDLSRYKLLILPDSIPVSEELAAKLDAFVAAGGALIASYKSGMDPEGTRFVLESLGVSAVGEAPYSPDFLLPQGDMGKGLPPTEHVMYSRGMQVQALPGTDVLAQTIRPYFNRTYKHFCSHQHTPSAGEVAYPGIVKNGRAIYFAHPIFTQYDKNAPRWNKQFFHNALDMLLPEPVIRHEGPTTLEVHLMSQPEKDNWVVHLLHYIPERRSQDIDIIEDVIPLYDVRISLNTPEPVVSAQLVPEGDTLPFEVREDGRTEFVIPCIHGHQMVEVRFK